MTTTEKQIELIDSLIATFTETMRLVTDSLTKNVDELKVMRDELSAGTHKLVKDELDKLAAKGVMPDSDAPAS